MAKTTSKSSKPKAVAVKAPPKPKVRKRNQVPKGKSGNTKIVLIEDVTFLGRQGELVEVRPGYARNYLIPNGLADLPTEHTLRRLEFYKIRIIKDREARIADLKSLAEQIRKTSITIEENVTEEGHLYGSVTGADIAKALRGRNLVVDADMIKLEEPIREVAVYGVPLVLGFEIDGVTPITSEVQVAVLPKK